MTFSIRNSYREGCRKVISFLEEHLDIESDSSKLQLETSEYL